jgi:hypothetical protein
VPSFSTVAIVESNKGVGILENLVNLQQRQRLQRKTKGNNQEASKD